VVFGRKRTRVRFLAGTVALAVLGAGANAAFSPPPAGGYLVRAGDTAGAIASHFGISLSDLVRANHLANADRIYAGERLRIPSDALSVVVGRAGAPRFPSRLLAHPDRLALRPSFRHWAPVYGVPTGLLEALAWMESGWQRGVVSSTGAVGIGQLEPSTVQFVCSQLFGMRGTLDPRNPDANIRMAAAFLGMLLRQTHGDVAMALGGYYQGLQSVRERGPMLVTRVYVAAVQGLWQAFRSG
jgi:soluble lytic murein transglycosylase-like protein